MNRLDRITSELIVLGGQVVIVMLKVSNSFLKRLDYFQIFVNSTTNLAL